MEAGGQGGQAGGQEAKEEVKKAKAESEAKASTSTAQAGDFKAVLPLLSFGFAALRDGRAAQRQRGLGPRPSTKGGLKGGETGGS